MISYIRKPRNFLVSYQCPVPERPITVALIQDYNFVLFCILPSYALLRVTFCVIMTVSQSEGTTVFCKLELHVLRQENLAQIGLIPR